MSISSSIDSAPRLLSGRDHVFRAIVDESPSGKLILTNNRVIYANRRAAEILGSTVDRLVALHAGDIVFPEYGVSIHRQTIDRVEVITLVGEDDSWWQTFDAVNSPIIITDPSAKILRANLAACSLAVLKESSLRGLPIDAAGRLAPWRTAKQLIGRVAANGITDSAETVDEEQRNWVLTVSPIAGDQFVVVMWEMTAALDLQKALQRSERLSSMGTMLAAVAHQLRNVLFGITSTLDAQAIELNRPEYREVEAAMRIEVGRLRRLADELLDYGRQQELQIDFYRLDEVIDAAILSVPARDVAIVNEVPRDLPDIAIDRERIRQVFVNVIENAVQFSPPAGSVRVSATPTRDAVECRVEDSGPGFPADEIDHVFDPFFTRRSGGTGLGLWIAHRNVEEHGGRIAVANRAGRGAVVTVRLPLAKRRG